MQISHNTSEMKSLVDNRIPDIFTIPEEWQNNDINIDSNKQYTISKPVSVEEKSTFWTKDMIIKILWQCTDKSYFQLS